MFSDNEPAPTLKRRHTDSLSGGYGWTQWQREYRLQNCKRGDRFGLKRAGDRDVIGVFTEYRNTTTKQTQAIGIAAVRFGPSGPLAGMQDISIRDIPRMLSRAACMAATHLLLNRCIGRRGNMHRKRERSRAGRLQQQTESQKDGGLASMHIANIAPLDPPSVVPETD